MTKWILALACFAGCGRASAQFADAFSADDDAYDAGTAQQCKCDSCMNNVTKLCQVQHGSGNPCNPGIPGGTPPDFRWVVSQGSWQSCAAISGSGTMTGYDYYGGTKQCTLQNCANYP